MMFKFKQVIIIRSDLGMGKGKTVVQGAHASIMASEKAKIQVPSVWKSWFNEGQRKIACKIQGKEEIFKIRYSRALVPAIQKSGCRVIIQYKFPDCWGEPTGREHIFMVDYITTNEPTGKFSRKRNLRAFCRKFRSV